MHLYPAKSAVAGNTPKKMLRRTAMAAAAVLLMGVGLATGATSVSATEPPQPTQEIWGTITVDGPPSLAHGHFWNRADEHASYINSTSAIANGWSVSFEASWTPDAERRVYPEWTQTEFSYQIMNEDGTPTKWYAAGIAAVYYGNNGLNPPSPDIRCSIFSSDPLYTDSAGQHHVVDAWPDPDAPYRCDLDRIIPENNHSHVMIEPHYTITNAS